MTFSYSGKIANTKALSIDNPANVCLVATNASADEYYLYVGTELGITTIVEFGPCTPDLQGLGRHVSITYDQFDYSDKRIDMRIDKFLNDTKRQISNVRVTTSNELRELFPDVSKVLI